MEKFFTHKEIAEIYEFCINEEIPISEKVIQNAQLVMSLIKRDVKAYIIGLQEISAHGTICFCFELGKEDDLHLEIGDETMSYFSVESDKMVVSEERVNIDTENIKELIRTLNSYKIENKLKA